MHTAASLPSGLLLAGHETTANTIVWAMYSLAKEPEVLRRAQQEVDSLEHYSSAADLCSLLPYCRKVFYEALRMFATVPVIGRTCVAGAYLPEIAGKTDAATGRIWIPA